MRRHALHFVLCSLFLAACGGVAEQPTGGSGGTGGGASSSTGGTGGSG